MERVVRGFWPVLIVAVLGAVPAAAAAPAPPAQVLGVSSAPSDPLCSAAYGNLPPRIGPRLRLGVDPGLAGSPGATQQKSVSDDPVRDLRALRSLRPRGRVLVVRLNRLFLADGARGIDHFARQAASYGRAGFQVEVQLRYHPADASHADLPEWLRFVRTAVHRLDANRQVIAMTITNEVNLTFSPNTSDGAYPGARDALIEGIETAAAQAHADHNSRLKFGFTYAYISSTADTALFRYLRQGGVRFRRALGFIGLDFYPGTIYPPQLSAGQTISSELAQAAGVVRRCLAPLAAIGPGTPLWITETGYPGSGSGLAHQATVLSQLVRAASAYSGTYGITDLRWFNLRDSINTTPGVPDPLFATDGLLSADYSPKPAFARFRSLIAALGAGTSRTEA